MGEKMEHQESKEMQDQKVRLEMVDSQELQVLLEPQVSLDQLECVEKKDPKVDQEAWAVPELTVCKVPKEKREIKDPKETKVSTVLMVPKVSRDGEEFVVFQEHKELSDQQ